MAASAGRAGSPVQMGPCEVPVALHGASTCEAMACEAMACEAMACEAMASHVLHHMTWHVLHHMTWHVLAPYDLACAGTMQCPSWGVLLWADPLMDVPLTCVVASMPGNTQRDTLFLAPSSGPLLNLDSLASTAGGTSGLTSTATLIAEILICSLGLQERLSG